MEPNLFSVMIFFLLAIMLTGGFVLLLPLSKQLAKYLEFRMKEKAGTGNGTTELEVRHLRALMESMEDKLRGLSERQEFLEKILESRDVEPPKLPR